MGHLVTDFLKKVDGGMVLSGLTPKIIYDIFIGCKDDYICCALESWGLASNLELDINGGQVMCGLMDGFNLPDEIIGDDYEVMYFEMERDTCTMNRLFHCPAALEYIFGAGVNSEMCNFMVSNRYFRVNLLERLCEMNSSYVFPDISVSILRGRCA